LLDVNQVILIEVLREVVAGELGAIEIEVAQRRMKSSSVIVGSFFRSSVSRKE